MIEQVISGTSPGFRLARFLIVVGVGMFLTRLVVMPLTRKMVARKVKTVTTQASVENITGIASGILFLSLALQIAGYGGLVTVLGTITAALTVAIGFGMREEVGSLVSGLFIQVNHPYLKGDYVEIGETRGRVDEIRLRSTVLKNVESDKVVVPNRVMTSDALKNYSKGRKTRASVEIKTSVENSKTVREALESAAQETEKVLEKPEPETSIEKIDEGSSVIQLKCFVGSSKDVDAVRSEILEKFSGKSKIKKIYSKNEE